LTVTTPGNELARTVDLILDDSIPGSRCLMRVVPLAALLLCGCYVNIPMTTSSPDPGTRLHVQLTDAGSVDLARYLGPNVISIDGRFIQADDSALSVSVNQVSMRSGDEQFWKGETVVLPRSAIAFVQRRKLSTWRSGLLAGVFLAGLAVLGSSTGGNAGGGGENGPPNPK
jgi:hypothetical protein